jgi:RND family efflux transporter MFP subunit
MRLILRPAALLAALLTAACGGDPAPDTPAGASARPVKTLIVGASGGHAQRNFPGRMEGSRRAELSFRVPGRVREILVKEGENVAEGALLARLDPTDFEVVLRDRKATYDTAERNYARARELVASGNISRYDYDRTEGAFRSAEAALSQARHDLAYTELRAPFAGNIARRHVERYEQVTASQAVLSLLAVDSLDVKIALPERVLRELSISRTQRAGTEEPVVRAWAEFEGATGQRFPLRLKEVATKADPKTQTFEVTFTMRNPDGFVVLPGMTTNVSVDFSALLQADAPLRVPASSVVADAQLGARVWLLDPQTMTVTSRAVRAGAMQGDEIEVLEGLQGGEELVTAGAALMAEGMKVTRFATGEQAAPRPDDPR